jgi:integrase
VGAVFNYAVKAGLATKTIAAEINRHDLPETTKAERRYLTHPQLLDLAEEMGRFETLTLVLGYCGCRFGEPAAPRIVETDTKTKWARRVPVPEPVWERLTGELPTESDALLFPGRKGGHLPLGEYRWVFDRALVTVRDAAKAKRRQKLADDGEVTTLTYPPLRYGVRKGPMKVVTLLTNSPKQLNHLGNQQTACRNLGSRAGKAGGPFVASSYVCSYRDKPERVVHHQQRLTQ